MLNYFVVSNYVFAQPSLNKSEIIRKSNNCFKDFKKQLCEKLIMDIEKIQLAEFEQNRYKCQSSMLGLQTELIKAQHIKKNTVGIMIPYVIKNC